MKNNATRPIRILQVVGGMNRGGAETWLMHVLRNIDRDRFKMDFLVHTDEPCAYDDEIRALGSRIIPCRQPSNPLRYAHNFKKIIKQNKPYDVIHSHVHHFSGNVLRLAHKTEIPIRISHSHLDTADLDGNSNFFRRCYLSLASNMIQRYATVGLAASQKAAVALFGVNWEADPRWRIFYCGIDLNPFRNLESATSVRGEFNISHDALVLGNVGRFMEQKNHDFLIDIMSEVVKLKPNTYLLLAGDGELRSVVEQKLARFGLKDRVIFTGVRTDIPQLMLDAIDIFVMPSFYEGLPLVGIEAQAAGLPIVLSDTITEEVDIVKPLVIRCSLGKSAADWAGTIVNNFHSADLPPKSTALSIIENTAFNIEVSLKLLEKIYALGATRGAAHE